MNFSAIQRKDIADFKLNCYGPKVPLYYPFYFDRNEQINMLVNICYVSKCMITRIAHQGVPTYTPDRRQKIRQQKRNMTGVIYHSPVPGVFVFDVFFEKFSSLMQKYDL